MKSIDKAKDLVKNGEYDQAIKIYKEMLSKLRDEKSDEAYSIFIGLGQVYLELKEWEEALYYFLRAEVIKTIPEVYLNIGVLFYKKENYQKALEYYKKAEKLGRPLFEIYWNKGLTYEKMKYLKDAVFSYSKAYEINPKTELLIKLAPLSLEAGLYNEAVKFYKELLKYEENPLYYSELGLAYMKLGMYDESKECYKRAKEITKLANKYKHIEELTYDDLVKKYGDNIEEKIKETLNKIEKDKNDYNNHYDLGNMMFIKGDYEQSLKFFKQARDIYVSKLITAKT
ncbi:MAG TPA: tetratricopeptide repeat protein [Spirochaetota bacterium]|nr:tetratricopeptide repeat protein [Spirochaetota bacterium]HOM38130.1 tetratricopeptide repeat protein [Spirochaetota bacterium]HPQ48933.1 tetratricopeptide repeat protein [Spirochaetota bacterium]